MAFLYNFWVIIYRYSFNEINPRNKIYWFTFDYFADFLYICDILFTLRTGFLEEGVLQTDPIKLKHHYMNTTRFYVDLLCLIPLDILYLSIGYNSMLRCFRLVKIYRFWAFLDRLERHTNFPNLFRTFVMLHYLFAIFHWNACLTYFLSHYLSPDLMLKRSNFPHIVHYTASSSSSSSSNSKQETHFINNEFSINNINKNDSIQTKYDKFKQKLDIYDDESELLKDYLRAFYLSAKLLTLVIEIPNPKTNRDYLFSIFQLVLSLLLFSAIIGTVGYIISNLNNAAKEFQCKLLI